MAILSSLLTHSEAPTITGTLATTTSSAAIEVGSNAAVAIVGTGNMHIKAGTSSGMNAASTSDFLIPSGVVYTMGTGRNVTHIRIYNPTAGNVTYYIQRLESAR